MNSSITLAQAHEEQAMVLETHEALPLEQTEETHTEVPHETGLLASLGINGQLFAFQLVNFALVVLILWFLILKPLVKTMDERKKIVNDGLDKAKAADTSLMMAEQKAKEIIDAAQAKGNTILSEASAQADTFEVKTREKAKKEIEGLVEQAKKGIEQDRAQMKTELRQETASIAMLVAEKLIGKKLDAAQDKKLTEEILNSESTRL